MPVTRSQKLKKIREERRKKADRMYQKLMEHINHMRTVNMEGPLDKSEEDGDDAPVSQDTVNSESDMTEISTGAQSEEIIYNIKDKEASVILFRMFQKMRLSKKGQQLILKLFNMMKTENVMYPRSFYMMDKQLGTLLTIKKEYWRFCSECKRTYRKNGKCSCETPSRFHMNEMYSFSVADSLRNLIHRKYH